MELRPITETPGTLYLDELNPAQKEAVLHGDGPMLVIAGAGSGKTKTLVYRVAHLVEQGVSPESILLLTFTRKSSEEMLRRAASILDERCRKISGGTFHSFANIILRQYGAHLGYENQFTILDRADSEDLIGMIRKDMGCQKTDKSFPKKSTIGSVIGKALNTGRPIDDVLKEDYPQFEDFSQDIISISSTYNSHKQAIQVMDYDDLLVQLRRLLTQFPAIREQLQKRYQYILVDEYQDTNCIQADILKALVGERRNIMVVGDDSQSIYSFRGAHFKNIMLFPEIFPGTKIVKLEENYRSVQPILDLTNGIIEYAKEKYAKTLRAFREGGDKPMYVEMQNDHSQSRFVVQKIQEYVDQGIPLSEIAVLIRSGWHSNDLEVHLKSSGIAFVKYGGFKFMETSHVKDVLAFMRLIGNPRDAISWNRVLMLVDGLGPKAASDLVKAMSASMLPETAVHAFSKKAFFAEVQEIFNVVFQSSRQAPSVLLASVLKVYKPLFEARYDDYSKRKSDLESLQVMIERYESLDVFLTDMSLDPPDISQANSTPQEQREQSMTLSTIHSAKGLEWKVVFLLSAVDGYLPSFQALEDQTQLEEERRLMYVALTRAKDHLFILKPRLEMNAAQYYRYPGMSLGAVSRFLSEGELLRHHADRWSLVEEVAQPKVSKLPAYLQNKTPSKSDVFYDSSRDGDLTEDLFWGDDKRKYRF